MSLHITEYIGCSSTQRGGESVLCQHLAAGASDIPTQTLIQEAAVLAASHNCKWLILIAAFMFQTFDHAACCCESLHFGFTGAGLQ